MSRVKFIAAEEAAMMIEDNSSLCVNGFVQCSIPEELFKAVENRFLETGHPRSIKLMFTASVGCGEEGGINHFAHEGLIRETYGAHYGVIRKLSPLINENKIKAYNIPQGVIIHLYRAMGGHHGEISSPNPVCFWGIDPLFSKEGLVIWRLFCSYIAVTFFNLVHQPF
jgi:propionate CoA-transferase